MRFLVDAQVPPSLTRLLVGWGHEAEHVADRGLAASSDGAIWDLAVCEGAVIVSKDEDVSPVGRWTGRRGGTGGGFAVA
jgi:predicted nuclease of predicted toxin-antitoxin system